MQYPEYNMNGDRPEDMEPLFSDAFVTLDIALRALMKVRPHARNYQTLCPKEYSDARTEHFAREEALSKICKEMNYLRRHASIEARKRKAKVENVIAG